MTLLLNIALAVFGLTSTLAAFGGETWRRGDQPLLERVTARGWLALSCLLLAFATGIAKEVRTHQASNQSLLAKQVAERENRTQRAQLAKQLAKIEDLQGQLTKSTIEQAKYAARIESLTGETRDLVTGGKSYVWILLTPLKNEEGALSMAAIHGGAEIPAFDVNVRFETTGQCDGFETWTMGKVMGTGINNPRRVYLPVATPNMLHPISVRLQPTCEDAYYFAYIYTRNRVLFQQTLVRKREGTWRVVARLLDLVTGATLHTTPNADIASKEVWPAEPRSNTQLLQVLKRLNEAGVPVAQER
jgi:hypothetical protein